jgi:hypothetical protein
MKLRVLKTMNVVIMLLGGCWATTRAFEGHYGHESAQDYSNEWVVRLEGGPDVAELLAVQLGYDFIGPVSHFIK